MSIATVFEIVLALLMLGLGLWTTVVRETYSATLGFIAYGLLLALVWVRLDAVDVALTEAAISGGLGGVLLLGAAAKLGTCEPISTKTPSKVMQIIAAILATFITTALACAVLLLPEPPPTLTQTVVEQAWATGMNNPVTNVLMAFRALDTVLEKIVLLLALIGVWSLAPDRGWGSYTGAGYQENATSILVFLARLLPPIGLVVGIYSLWTGANNPGGAFQGGAILASMWLLTIMAGLVNTPPTSSLRLRLVLIAGPSLFMIVGLAGLGFGIGFLAYPPTMAKPLIIGIEIAMLVTITATLVLLVIGAPQKKETQ